MKASWKFAKGTYLTLFVVGGTGIVVLLFAYHQKRYSEILTGVIGGTTIILGMVTAEWLRDSREQVERTKKQFDIILSNFKQVLYNAEFLLDEPYSEKYSVEYARLINTRTALSTLGTTTKWPQPNARKIREAARELETQIFALYSDATESGYLWSVEKRWQLISESNKILGLIVGNKNPESSYAHWINQTEKYRETPLNTGLPLVWVKKLNEERFSER